MDGNDDSPPAEKISDDELLARASAALEQVDTPFLTTEQANAAVDELKSDQVRNRLTSLGEQERLAYHKARGYIFWNPEAAGDAAGEIELDLTGNDRDWEELSADRLPPDLLKEAAEYYNQQGQPYPAVQHASRECFESAGYLAVSALTLTLFQVYLVEGRLAEIIPQVAADLTAILIGIALLAAVLLFPLHLLLSGILKLSTRGPFPETPVRRLDSLLSSEEGDE